MKPISQSQWERYKQTDGKYAIEKFERLLNLDLSPDELMDFLHQINPSVFQNSTAKEKQTFLDCIDFWMSEISETPTTEESTLADVFSDCLARVANLTSGTDLPLDDIPEKDFKPIVGMMMPMSLAWSGYYNGFFIPYLWTMEFYFIERIAQKYEIELPEIPTKSKYFDRCLFYIGYCDCFVSFAESNNLSRAELCAFLYDYELNLLREELAETNSSETFPDALQAWFLVGSKSEGEKVMESGFWQANPATKRGDIFIFYEKAPVKSINAVWRATTDGTIDPAFLYYSSANIANKIDIPAITLDDLHADDYFKNHPLIHKNFQGGSGWPLNSEDYSEIKRILSEKGFDVNLLPNLKAHETPKDVNIEVEADVHNKMVLPLLEKMGWTEKNGHIANQVTLHVGRGETKKDGRTDVSLHPFGENGKYATVIIEEKFWMKNEAEIQDAFNQGESYAKLSNANVMVTCDKQQIRVYHKSKNGLFDPFNPIIFYWDELSNPDNFKELFTLIK